MATVHLDRVVKIYPSGHIAADGVDLAIRDGEFFVLVGPSGCGKTTVLRMIAGFETVSSGVIEIDGRDVEHVGTRDRGLAMLFQDTTVYPHLTVRSNLAFPLEVAHVGRREIARRVTEVADLLGLTALLDLLPGQLSGGQRQRVAMGRLFMREPVLMLMDEPMSNLDAKLRTELRGQLALLHRRLGVTTLYVTHDQVEAMALGDRVAVMRAGRIVQVGPPLELYERPVDAFVATFVGSPPMNLLGGRIIGVGGGFGLMLGQDTIDLGNGRRWIDLAGWTDHDVVVGIRPEACVVREAAGPNAIHVEIAGVEHLGADQLVTATVGAPGARVTDEGVAVDDVPLSEIHVYLEGQLEVDLWRPVAVELDVERLHLFDPMTGLAIPSVDPAAVR